MIKIFTTMVAGIIIISGCATQKEIMIQEGHSVAYAEGFDDGCHSGKKAAGNMFEHFKKDENKFERLGKYAQGWSDGFRECESEEEAMDRQIRMGMEQQRLNEERKRNKRLDDYYFGQHALSGIKYDVKALNTLK